eukprot:s1521_g11.t1
MFAGRPFECMKPTIDLLVKIEKMLEFLVEAGFNPERLQFLVPMSKMRGTNEEKAQMRHVISNFLARLLKGTFPNKKHYAYFRHVDEGFEEVIHFTPLIVYLIHRIKERSDEVLITARQSGVILPPDFQAKIDFTMSYASAEAARGLRSWAGHSHGQCPGLARRGGKVCEWCATLQERQATLRQAYAHALTWKPHKVVPAKRITTWKLAEQLFGPPVVLWSYHDAQDLPDGVVVVDLRLLMAHEKFLRYLRAGAPLQLMKDSRQPVSERHRT